VGANKTFLTPASGETTGLKYQIAPAVRVYNNVAYDPDPLDWRTLSYTDEAYDTHTMHSTSTNTDRLTVPTDGDGVYDIGASITFDTGDEANDSDMIGIRVLLNGATDIGGVLHRCYRSETTDQRLNLSIHYDLDATDYVVLQCYTKRNINVLVSAFWACWLRGAAT
jgi:hypothetical protein